MVSDYQRTRGLGICSVMVLCLVSPSLPHHPRVDPSINNSYPAILRFSSSSPVTFVWVFPITFYSYSGLFDGLVKQQTIAIADIFNHDDDDDATPALATA